MPGPKKEAVVQSEISTRRKTSLITTAIKDPFTINGQRQKSLKSLDIGFPMIVWILAGVGVLYAFIFLVQHFFLAGYS